MRQIQCERCQATLPAADTWTVLGTTACEPCGNAILAQHNQKLAPGDVVRNTDPTICHRCQADEGVELPTVAGMPTCAECSGHLRNFPFPTWIKLSFVVLVGLAIAAFFYNYRFVDGLFASHRASKALGAGNIDRAADHMERAARLIPEAGEFRTSAELLRGIQLLKDDRSREALPLLVSVYQKNPGDPSIHAWLLHAEIAVAFEDKHYDVMLEKAFELAQVAPNEPRVKYSIASAYACRYAETGDAEFKEKALEAMAEGDTGTPDASEREEYHQRMAHRLATREIIEKVEYDKRFPNGWKAGEAPAAEKNDKEGAIDQ